LILLIVSIFTSCSILNKDKTKERNDLKRNQALIEKCDRNKYSKSTEKINRVEKDNYVY